jgi:protein-disulfide isomerase
MLVFGLIGGFFGRPLLSGLTGERSIASSETAPSSDVTADPQDQPANPDELMAYVVGQTRHFFGDPNAPVTIIEFSDFQ